MNRLFTGIAAVALGLALTGCETSSTSTSKEDTRYTEIIHGQENRIGALERDISDWKRRAETAEFDLAQANERLSVLGGKGSILDNSALLNHIDEIDRRISRMATAKGDVEVTALPDGMGYKITILGDVLFDSGKAEIRAEGQKLLAGVVADLKQVNGIIRIDGHTDNVRIAKPETKAAFPKGNWQLGSERALNTLLYLKDQGVSEKKMFYTSWGEYAPRASNGNEEGKRLNRRVEIIVLLNGDPVRASDNR